MQYRSNKGFTGWSQFGMLILFLGLGILATGFFQLIIGYFIIPKGTPYIQMESALLQAMKNPKNVTAIRIMQIIGGFFTLFMPALLYSIICNGKKVIWLGFNKYINIYQILIGALIIFSANYMASPLEDISKKIIGHFPSVDILAQNLENQYDEQVEMLGHIRSLNDFFLSMLIMAFLPALFEEMFFRGALQSLLVKWWKQPLIAIIVTSIIFSLIHMSYYLFLNRALLGFALGMMFYQTKNIWVNVFAHFINNAFVIGQMYFMSTKAEKIDITQIDSNLDWWFAVPFAILLYFLFKMLNKHSQENKMKAYAQEQLLADNPEMWAK